MEPAKSLRIAHATDDDLQAIYRIRHEVYATELGQHAENDAGELRDELDGHNEYLVVKQGNEVAGFVSITPPDSPSYSIDKYVSRDDLPFNFDDHLYEVRILTVCDAYRGLPIAPLLLFAAFRWIEHQGGTHIFGIGRSEVKQIYAKAGAKPLGIEIRSGSVTYEVMSATVEEYRETIPRFSRLINRLERRIDWRLDVPFDSPEPCFHGGAFFEAVGVDFHDLRRRHEVINADVLDAWFPPSPTIAEAFAEHMDWLSRTSPPTHCEGMVRTIAEVRGVDSASVLPGAGSSSLIYLAFQRWLNPSSRVLILDPTYGEYEHVLERVVGCRVDRFVLEQADDFDIDTDSLAGVLTFGDSYDLVVLVNPNSPTGRHARREDVERLLDRVPRRTRVWLDETYVEYAGAEESLERYAAASANVFVCKSMSKVYALSGMRAAYLCGPPTQISALRISTPPWSVGLPGQVAAVKALQDPDYYETRYRRTHEYRVALAGRLEAMDGVRVTPSVTNFLLFDLPSDGPDAATVVRRCRERGLFLRVAGSMGTSLGRHAVRTAVKTPAVNGRIVEILEYSLRLRSTANAAAS